MYKRTIALLLVASLSFFGMSSKAETTGTNSGKASVSAQSQDGKTAKGTIVDAEGTPLIGAGVLVKGTTNGAIADENGNFVIEGVAAGTVLEISHIGYLSQDLVWQGTPLSVVLADDTEQLDQVVVIGYGTMKKSDLTGAVEKADLTAVKTAPNSNVLQALQGNVAGLNIGQTNTAGAEPSIEVRGQITIGGSTDPLIVLDGIVYNGNIGDINPTDIESIDILKDASSKAVYGAKAANGVMMITTKAGNRERAPKITYSSNWSWSNPTVNIRPLNREEWMKKARDVDWRNAYTAESGYLEENPDWSWTSTGMNAVVYEGIENGVDYDWWGNATQTGHLHTNTVSVNGGSKTVSYFISGGYTDQAGIIKNDDYTRTTLRTNIDIDVTSWLTVGTNNFLSFSDYSGDCPSISTVARMPAVVVPKDENGNWIVNPSGSNLVNPYLNAEAIDSNKRSQINSTVYALVEVPWVKGLTYRLNYNFTKSVTLHNAFNQYDSGQTGAAYKQTNNTDYWLFDNIVNYTRSFGKNNVNATFVYGMNRRAYDTTKASGTQYANFSLGYNDLAQAVIQTIDSSAWEEANLYQMFRIAYNYDSKYLLTATMRRDGFSGFAANHKFGYFPSVGLGWVISKEEWMKDVKNLDNLKLRASYGVTGNQTSRYSSLAKVGVLDGYVYGDGGSTATGSYVSAMANNDLKWETTAEFNVGVDYSFFGNRLMGSIDLYNAKTTDLLWDVSLPSMTGYGSVKSNVGELNNKGLEISLQAVPVETKDFGWTINTTFSTNKNKIVSLLGDTDGDGVEDDLISDGLFIGQSLGAIYDYEIEGIWQIEDEENGLIPDGHYVGGYKIKDQNNDGVISPEEDRVILGTTDPAFRLGIRNTFTYKGLDFSFFLNIINGGKNGYLAKNEKANFVSGSYGNATNQNFWNCYDYWSPSNTDATFANAWDKPAVEADIYQSRSFVRLQDISLGYTFNDTILKRAKINAFRLFVSAKNLLTFTKWDGWDPEMALGVNDFENPVMKTFAFGAEITF